MPKEIADFENLEEAPERVGGKKVDWPAVAEAINNSRKAWTVKEIHEKFVEKKVGQFRTRNALEKLVEDGKLRRKWDEKRLWYGPIEG